MQHCNMSVPYTHMCLGAPNGAPVIDVRVSSRNKAFVTGRNYHALASHKACAWSGTMRSGQTREASIENGYVRHNRHIASRRGPVCDGDQFPCPSTDLLGALLFDSPSGKACLVVIPIRFGACPYHSVHAVLAILCKVFAY